MTATEAFNKIAPMNTEQRNKAIEKLITDAQLDAAFGNADFGEISKRDIIKNALLKTICGYHNGYTAQCIIHELGLAGKSRMKGGTLTIKGKEYLWAVYGEYGF